MTDKLRKGDKVRWKSHGGEAVGEVEEVIRKETPENGTGKGER